MLGEDEAGSSDDSQGNIPKSLNFTALDSIIARFPKEEKLKAPKYTNTSSNKKIDKVLIDKTLDNKYPNIEKNGYYTVLEKDVEYHYVNHMDVFHGFFRRSTVYPGNLLRVRRAVDGLADDAPALNPYREEGKISLNVLNGTDNPRVSVSDFSPDAMLSKVNWLVSQHKGGYPADVKFDIKSVYSEKQCLDLIGHMGRNKDVQEMLKKVDWEEKSTKKVLVHLRQRYFSVTFEPPSLGAEGFFNAKSEQDKVAQILNEEVEEGLAYISEVDYGRTLIMLLEENSAERGLFMGANSAENQVKQMYKSLKEGNLELAKSYTANLGQAMNIYALQYGGIPIPAIVKGAGGLGEVLESLARSADYEKGTDIAPLAYKLRRLDNGHFVKYVEETKGQYHVVDYIPHLIGDKLIFELEALKSMGVSGPTGGNYRYVSRHCHFIFKGLRIKKYVNGSSDGEIFLGEEKRFGGRGEYYKSYKETHTFTGLDPLNEDTYFKVEFGAKLYGERYSDDWLKFEFGSSGGKSSDESCYAIIEYNKNTEEWEATSAQSAAGNWGSKLRIYETCDRCQFDISVYYSFYQ